MRRPWCARLPAVARSLEAVARWLAGRGAPARRAPPDAPRRPSRRHRLSSGLQRPQCRRGANAMSDDVPQELETIDPNNPPEGYTGPTPLQTIDPNNPPDGYTGPTPLETIDPNNPPDGYTGPTQVHQSQPDVSA